MKVNFKSSCFLICLLIFCSFINCGGVSLYSYIVPDSDRDVFDVHVALGKSYYDRRMFSKAYEHMNRAYELNPDSEDAAITLGFIILAMAGGETLDIVGKILKSQKKTSSSTDTSSSTSTDTSTETSTTTETDSSDTSSSSTSTSTSTSSSSNSLTKLTEILGVSDDEFAKLGTKNLDDADLPVIEPICAEEARKLISRLGLIEQAITIVCKFVDDEARIKEDSRHTCPNVSYSRKKSDSAHFVWGLSHLLEAIAFNQVLNYSTNTLGKTNLEARIEKVKQIDLKNPDNIATFSEKLQSMSLLITKVLPVSITCSELYPTSQMNALVNDLVAVGKGFSKIKGAPPQLLNSVSDIVKKIQDARDKAASSDQTAKVQAQIGSLKDTFTKNMQQIIKDKLDAEEAGSFSEEQTEKLCASFKDIKGDLTSGGDAPKICNE